MASAQSSQHYVKVHFLYGSKPARGYEATERKRFGGIMGGHVSLEIQGRIFGFAHRGAFHVFPKRKERHSFFHNTPLKHWAADTTGEQYLTIVIPLTGEQYRQLLKLKASFLKNPPYDYAFFGYRCAASGYQMLASAGVFGSYGNYRTVKKFFYPKKLRNFLVKEALKKNYTMHFRQGKASRKWEKDKRHIRKLIREAVG